MLKQHTPRYSRRFLLVSAAFTFDVTEAQQGCAWNSAKIAGTCTHDATHETPLRRFEAFERSRGSPSGDSTTERRGVGPRLTKAAAAQMRAPCRR